MILGSISGADTLIVGEEIVFLKPSKAGRWAKVAA